jgi:hypothetical protein
MSQIKSRRPSILLIAATAAVFLVGGVAIGFVGGVVILHYRLPPFFYLNTLRHKWPLNSLVNSFNMHVYDASADIVMLGDSITAFGDWAKLLRQPNILNLGISDDTSAGVLNRLNQTIARKPRTVFLMIGINDLFNDIPSDLIERHIQLIASQLVKNGIKPIIQSTLFVQGNSDLNAKIRALDDGLRQWCSESKIIFIDLNEVLSTNGSLRADVSDDGVHLNNNGYIL